MPKIAYVTKRFNAKTLATIAQANRIIDSYAQQGLSLSLRQLYYRFVAADLIPNSQAEYKKLGTVISDGRLAGLIDWDAIEDRGRNLLASSTWSSPAGVIKSAAYSYAIDLWSDQQNRVEVWVEKEALIGVVSKAAQTYQASSFACKGYTSQSEMWRAGRRFKRYQENGQQPIVIHLGDHDPSGIDMSRDIKDRLRMFAEHGVFVNRIALNMDQVQQYNPPPNPAKMKDTRAPDYVTRFGYDSWELDALEPKVLKTLIEDTILKYLDKDRYDKLVDKQEHERDLIFAVAEDWKTAARPYEEKLAKAQEPPDDWEDPDAEDGKEP